jgi:hypothetical protein
MLQRQKDIAINDILDYVQSNNHLLLWSEMEGIPINKFQMLGYMVRAFPTLYSYSLANLRSEHPRDIKPAEYFKHLVWYKNRRFAWHTCWYLLSKI